MCVCVCVCVGVGVGVGVGVCLQVYDLHVYFVRYIFMYSDSYLVKCG